MTRGLGDFLSPSLSLVTPQVKVISQNSHNTNQWFHGQDRPRRKYKCLRVLINNLESQRSSAAMNGMKFNFNGAVWPYAGIFQDNRTSSPYNCLACLPACLHLSVSAVSYYRMRIIWRHHGWRCISEPRSYYILIYLLEYYHITSRWGITTNSSFISHLIRSSAYEFSIGSSHTPYTPSHLHL